ncbi:hypothetical protein ELQ88_28270 [Pseudomonas sp. MPC6]|nr:hypothetical protein ELQ88_28270 [Pseudomonas sp. MPC6]
MTPRRRPSCSAASSIAGNRWAAGKISTTDRNASPVGAGLPAKGPSHTPQFMGEATDAFAGKPAPTGGCVGRQISRP